MRQAGIDRRGYETRGPWIIATMREKGAQRRCVRDARETCQRRPWRQMVILELKPQRTVVVPSAAVITIVGIGQGDAQVLCVGDRHVANVATARLRARISQWWREWRCRSVEQGSQRHVDDRNRG